MYFLLKFKKIISKLLTCWILSKKARKNARNFLFYFSLTDYIRFKKQNFYIVSLGHNCLPRVLATVVKLKPRKMYGEKTCPFDLSLNFDINKIAELINNNFENFFDNLEFNETDKRWENKYLNSIYVHDSKLSRKQFEIRYSKRINNFLNIINSDKIIYFIYYPHSNESLTKENILTLYNSLFKRRNNKPFKLIIIVPEFINDINEQNICQIVESCDLEPDWLNAFINEYGEINNKYTQFVQQAGDKLKKIIQN